MAGSCALILRIQNERIVPILPLLSQRDPLAKAFLLLARRYCELASAENLSTRETLRGNDCDLFSSLPPQRKHAALDRLVDELELFEEIRSSGWQIRDSRCLLRSYLQKHAFAASACLFDKLNEDDPFVVYDTADCLIFQGPRFLECHRLSVEEIFCRAWELHGELSSIRPKWVSPLHSAGSPVGRVVIAGFCHELHK